MPRVYTRMSDEERKEARRLTLIKYHASQKGKDCQNRRKLKDNDKIKARSDLNHGLRDGKVFKVQYCEGCGKEVFLEAHHFSYNYPLDVLWVCRKCHNKIHRSV